MSYRADKFQAQNWENSTFKVKFVPQGQGRLPPKTKGTSTKVFCTFAPNLVILTWMGPDSELWHGQACDWLTDWHKHKRRQRQYPKANIGKKRVNVRVKC